MNKLLTFVMLFMLISITADAQNEQRRRRPRFFKTDTLMVHDPVMAYEDGKYYIFSTGMGISMVKSDDRKTWTFEGKSVLDEIPAWTQEAVPGFRNHVWAPDVIYWHNKWWMMYSCSTFGKNTSAIGLLSSPTLADAHWTDEGCVITSKEKRDNWNAIDPNIVIDDKDCPWMTFGSFWDGIQLVKLDNTMHVAKNKKPKTIAKRYKKAPAGIENPTSKFAGTNAIEAPFIFKHDGWYYLFASWDYCCRGEKSSYNVVVGRSKKVNGPYIDREGRKMIDGGGTVFFQGDKKEFEAAGHCAVYHMGNKDIFICHGYSIPMHGQSILIQKEIKWTADGWPEV